jgi:hypothetical protein
LLLAHGLSVEWRPTYAPKLTDIHVVWRDLKAHHLGHQTFADGDALDRAIHQAIDALNASAPTFRWSGHESLLRKCDVSGIRLTSVPLGICEEGCWTRAHRGGRGLQFRRPGPDWLS